MGAYVNPEDMSKEEWLEENATEFPLPIPWDKILEGYMPIVLVQNQGFAAAAIGFSREEYSVFINPNDERPKRYFYCNKIEELHSVSPELAGYIEQLDDGKPKRSKL